MDMSEWDRGRVCDHSRQYSQRSGRFTACATHRYPAGHTFGAISPFAPNRHYSCQSQSKANAHPNECHIFFMCVHHTRLSMQVTESYKECPKEKERIGFFPQNYTFTSLGKEELQPDVN